MSRFPLLRLPTLPLLNCIQYLKVFEIIDFSLLSKRTKALVSLVNWNHPDIHANFYENSKLCLKFPNDPGLQWILDFRVELDDELDHNTKVIDGNQFPSYIDSALHGPKAFHYLTFPNDEHFETMRKMAEHVSAIFRTPIASLSTHRLNNQLTMSIVKWLSTLQPSVVDLDVTIDDITAPTLLCILDNIKVTDHFDLDLKMSTPGFEYNKAIDIPSVILSHSQWITLKSILNSSSRVIVLCESNLTFWDINSFLKHWLNGSNPKLEYISIRRSMKGNAIEEDIKEAFQIITKDLEVREHEENEKRPMRIAISLHRPSSYSPPNDWCYDIVRDDGTIGTIHQTYFNRSDVPDFKFHYFYLHVWNKKKKYQGRKKKMRKSDPKKLFGDKEPGKKVILVGGEMKSEEEERKDTKKKAGRETRRNRTVEKKPALAAGVVAVDTGMSVAMGLARVKTTGPEPQTVQMKEVVGRATKAGEEARVQQQLTEGGDPGSTAGPSTSGPTGSPASGEPSTPSSSAAPRQSRRR
ncbi:hypothetical protein CRE_03479 [Caenorhabditis remanei]|uniref:F-box domain-containing protein n=1 Tax=Caenorhabditis remanei TaxID=31234 RepID=E3NGQ0_CAERE|nr:hypothetical protein CRE_03479 [Caenorhabditis remanei]